MLMGVMPGYSGQEYGPETDARIAAVRAAIDRAGLDTLIEVDGGIKADTARRALAAGVDVLVSASFVFSHPRGYAAALQELRDAAPDA
jgi:ribulose-phosphate 3-epimerase